MKSKNKPAPAAAAPTPAPLSPRELSLRKHYRTLTIVGIVALIVGGAVAGTIYRDTLFNLFGKKRLFTGHEIVYREPKLNPNPPPGTAPPDMVWIPGGEFYMGA